MKRKILTLILVLATFFGVVAVSDNKTKDVEAASTCVIAGSFNGWNTSKTPMSWNTTKKYFEIVIDLKAGDVFKVVLNGTWIGWNGYSIDKGKNTYLKEASSDGNFAVKTSGKYLIYCYDKTIDNPNYGPWAGDLGIEIHTCGAASSSWQTNDDNHWKVCSCGEKVENAAHNWDAGVVTQAPTLNAEGVKTYTCTSCAKEKTESIPQLVLANIEDLKTIFTSFYNDGNYTRTTVINVNTENTTINENLKQIFHASSGDIKRIKLTKTTYFAKDYLWFNDDGEGAGHGYGTSADNHLTGINADKDGNIVGNPSYTHATYKGMEDYYCTLNDFVVGEHTSEHTKGQKLTLNTGWTYDATTGEYSNTSKEVIDAFILFTAPTWLPLTSDTANYFTFTKAVVKVSGTSLILQLIVEGDEGKLVSGANNIFSQATITTR